MEQIYWIALYTKYRRKTDELHSVRILYNSSPCNLFPKFNDKFYSSSVVIFHFAEVVNAVSDKINYKSWK